MVRAWLDNPATRFEQFFLDISRQWGKTFLGLLVSDELARRLPRARIAYVAPTRADLWQFVQPNMDTLLADCPDDLRPHWSTTENSYLYATGSVLHLSGANNGHENDARGPKADLVVNEEAAFVDRLDYLITSVEIPQLMTTGGKILHITTRPETPAHEVTKVMTACQLRGNYLRRTIDENRHLSGAAREKIIEECGGRQSTKALRELFCESVVDEARAIVPEYTEQLDKELCASEPPPPTYEQPTVAMDVGFEDFHHILFGYYDFARGKRVIQAEVRLQRATTDKIATAIGETEARLWGENKKLEPAIRWSDTDLRLIADLGELHSLGFAPTPKDDKEAQVNALRMTFKNKAWHISPSCVHLRRQLRLGVWNKSRTEFDRSAEDGHFDAVDAAIYFNRNLDVYTNPYPALPPDVTMQTHVIHPDMLRPTGTALVLTNMFKVRTDA